MDTYEYERQQMVDRQIAARGVSDRRLLDAMREVPRHKFVPDDVVEFAYRDTALPLFAGQTVSQPYIVARMLEAAQLSPGDRVLDVGTGSGYAAAIAARLALHVDSVERYEPLAQAAKKRLAEQGFANIDVHAADGTLGWPARAPFDAIIAAAGGPDVPPAWREQLAIGGRLVMPIGTHRECQRLIKMTRRSATQFDEEEMDEVRFVPLIGEQGWPAVDSDGPFVDLPETEAAAYESSTTTSLAGLISAGARPLPAFDDASFGSCFEFLASKRIVLLGECSHGTAEFYDARAAITRHLVEKHNFNMVALEADWPDVAVIDQYVRLRKPDGELSPFQRFPTWMWRNEEFAAFVRWMHAYNGLRDPARRCAVHGLDMYSLSASVAAVLDYLDRTDPEAASVARLRYGCLTPWQKDPQVYGRAALSKGFETCENAVVEQLCDLMSVRLEEHQDAESLFDAMQNARLVASAENYYRTMYRSSGDSWNLRDTHMFETLERLLDSRGPDSKAIVWAHNSHIGDAAATEMGRVRDELNLGQLCRERFGDGAALVGLGTHTGAVAAATDWDGPMQIKAVRPARPDSYEYQFHQSGHARCVLEISKSAHPQLYEQLREPRLERFIGVIYRPETELYSHYAEASLAEQFDAYVWFDSTRAVSPLATRPTERAPDLYPFGL
ncbi:protein-L-isoaspartate(D-aspartate) O-methyltransferase [Paraburkholderia hospita]|uniref:protein-L-isoaspartate(D-aspartate) O-methyltransferase n=2 Tax=Burkholderiaceae TaxID=119060 RepID=UPI000B345390|nr:protein-L-isoaspartate(D-aspartate) O-methyltransferase [Paraburkholderia hospita]OUL82252.1 protein-L-isoaspartate O-methyltransferase [Paraburkholderia hospita]